MGVKALGCLAPFFSVKGGNCDVAVKRALTQCGSAVTAFEDCKKQFNGSPSMPTLPSISIGSGCSRSGSPTLGMACKESFACAGSSYVTFCNPTPQSTMLLDCGCVTPTGQMATGRMNASVDPCLDATMFCQ
jgi:hypothetical protein